MAKIITEADYRERFNRIMEYTQAIAPTRLVTEADPAAEDPMAGGADPMAGGGAPADPMAGGADPMAGGAPADPMAGGGAPAGGGADPMAGGAPAGGGAEGGVQGLNPQGGADPMAGGGAPADPMAGGAEGEENEDDDIETMEDGDEVIDIDALTGYQKKTATGVGKVSDEIKDLKRLIMKFQDKVEANNQGIENLQKELERRAPNAEEKMNLRQTKSGPFTQSIENYWQNNAPDNYSIESDNNGEDNPKYQITKDDIDGISDWGNIAKSFDDMSELNSLRNIFDF
jgi:hypothetical protein